MRSDLLGDDRLSLSVTHADDRITRWGPDEPNPTEIPGDLTFSTAIPGGNKDLSCSLLRQIDVDYDDQGLFDDVRVYGPGNREAWSGRMAQFPRSHGDGFQIVPGAVGWSAHLNDDPSFMEVYVDRDLSKWGQASVQRRLNVLATYTIADPTIIPDDTTGQPSLQTSFNGTWTTSSRPQAEAWYKAAPVSIGSLYFAWKKNANVSSGADTSFNWLAHLSTDDVLASTNATSDLQSAGPGSNTLTASGAAKKFALVQHLYDGTGGAANTEYAVMWTCLAVYGTHGLTKQGTDSATSAKGFYASDVVRDIVTRIAPKLTIGEIEATTFVVPHLVFDTPTTAESAIQFVNAYHGFDWGVYDNREFFYRASDPDRLTWQARLSTGARLDLEGETAEQIFNGVFVVYQDPSGQRKTVGPPGATADATDAQLQDTSATNPVNAHGISRRWGILEISQVTTLAGATQLGAIWLAQHGAPQRRGTLTLTGTVTHPTEGDVPVWRVRAGDYVSISDHPADVPRRIIETRYSHGGRSITLNLDNTPYVLDALLQRFGAGLVGVL
jgi:hypothetical protein